MAFTPTYNGADFTVGTDLRGTDVFGANFVVLTGNLVMTFPGSVRYGSITPAGAAPFTTADQYCKRTINNTGSGPAPITHLRCPTNDEPNGVNTGVYFVTAGDGSFAVIGTAVSGTMTDRTSVVPLTPKVGAFTFEGRVVGWIYSLYIDGVLAVSYDDSVAQRISQSNRHASLGGYDSQSDAALDIGDYGGAPATNANAGVATGTGAAFGAKATVAPTAGAAAGTGTAFNPTAAKAVSAAAGLASGTGTAYAPSRGIAPTAGAAAGTGTAYGPKTAAAPVAGCATGTGTAFNPTASTSGSTNAQAGCATGTGTAYGPTVSAGPVPGCASGTGTAFGIKASCSPTAGVALGTGAAHNPQASASPVAGCAAGTGTAHGATASVSSACGRATGTGIAYGPSVSISAPAGIATGTGAAYGPFAQTGAMVRVQGRIFRVRDPRAFQMADPALHRARDPRVYIVGDR